ncbi:MAG: ABC transporter substrate-binding protein, partial [Deltaproteobacteria bacterium]|nr:ABC transporter substrate-binding protein [Deltaproteobacteria bacterium]
MKQKPWEKVVLFLLALALTLFLSQSVGAASKPIVIGGSLPLTGKFAETAKWIEKGMKFWAEETNAKGGLLGRKVVFKIYDDESNAGKAVTFAEKAITVDKVDLLFGGYPGTA